MAEEPTPKEIADARIAKGVCPECEIPLAGVDPKAHALSHYPAEIPDHPEHKDAIYRQALLMKYAPVKKE